MSIIGRALTRGLVTEWLRALPDVVRLAWRVVRDSRVPAPIRAGIGGIAAYAVLPIDVIPDWLPLAGRIDDAVVFALGMRALLRRVDDDILLEHWGGSVGTLGRLLGKTLPDSGDAGRTIDVEPVRD